MFTKFIVSLAVAGVSLVGLAGNAAAGYPSYADCLNSKGVTDKCVQISDGSWVILQGYREYTDCLSHAGARERCYQDPNGFWYSTPI